MSFFFPFNPVLCPDFVFLSHWSQPGFQHLNHSDTFAFVPLCGWWQGREQGLWPCHYFSVGWVWEHNNHSARPTPLPNRWSKASTACLFHKADLLKPVSNSGCLMVPFFFFFLFLCVCELSPPSLVSAATLHPLSQGNNRNEPLWLWIQLTWLRELQQQTQAKLGRVLNGFCMAVKDKMGNQSIGRHHRGASTTL